MHWGMGGLGVGLGILLGGSAAAQVTQRVSIAWDGAQANSFNESPAMSPDGRFVVFTSLADNLVPGDTNLARDVFLRDRQAGVTERVSVNSDEIEGNGESYSCSVSADGRYVAFASLATNLAPIDTNGVQDVFVRDRQQGTTLRGSIGVGDTEANGDCQRPLISADGRLLIFSSLATNLVPGDTNGTWDAIVRDLSSGTTGRLSVDSSGIQANASSFALSVSLDGRTVAFTSAATNLVPGDTNGSDDVFVRDLHDGTTERVSIDSSGAEALGQSFGGWLSSDGRYVAFLSFAPTLVPGDTNGAFDVFVRDRIAGTTERVSVDSQGGEANGMTGGGTSISADGRYVAFESYATNLVPGDTNGTPDFYVHDRQTGVTERVSVAWNGAQGNDISEGDCPLSADGRYLAFSSDARNLVPDDTNGHYDIFVRDRWGGPAFASLCDPGLSGVIPCPCANPPASPGTGCDNSAATGGARLDASGGTYLSSDTLVFTTSGETPTALSILAQWTGVNGTGVVYGMGVRCTSGTFKRLFSASAVAGSVTFPDFVAGDPSISARSAAKGDVIQPGQSRWYLVYYRDPNVLGGCPATSNFNATQTGQATWTP